MKVHQITCPKCQASLTSKAGIEESTVIPCPKCKAKFRVEAPKQEEEIIEDFEVVDDDEEEIPKKSAAKPALKPISKQRKVEEDDEEDEDEEGENHRKAAAKPTLKPLSKQRKVEEDDEEDEEEETPKKAAAKPTLKPLSKQRKVEEDDEEEEDEAPRKPAAKQRKVEEEEDDEDEDEAPRKPAAKSTLKPLSRKRSDDDDDDGRPKKASGAFSKLDEDDDERPARRKNRDEDDEDEDESPRARRKSRDEDDEDEDEPRRRGRRGDDDEDEDDDEPKSTYAKLKSNIYVRASVLGVLLVIMGVLGYLLYEKYKKKGDSDSAKNGEDDVGKPLIKDDRKPTGQPQPKMGNRHAGEGRIHVAAQGFSIVKPPDWQTSPNIGGAFLVLRGPPGAFQVNLNVRSQPYDGTSLDQMGAQVKSLMPKIVPSYRFVEEGKVSIDGQQAYFIVHGTRLEVKDKPPIDVMTIQYFVISNDKKKAFILTFADLASEFNGRRKLFDDTAASVRTD